MTYEAPYQLANYCHTIQQLPADRYSIQSL